MKYIYVVQDTPTLWDVGVNSFDELEIMDREEITTLMLRNGANCVELQDRLNEHLPFILDVDNQKLHKIQKVNSEVDLVALFQNSDNNSNLINPREQMSQKNHMNLAELALAKFQDLFL